MAQHEKDTFSHEQYDSNQLEKIGESQREKISEQFESSKEKDPSADAESARREALEQASSTEKEPKRNEKLPENEHYRSRSISKKDKSNSFNATMREVRSQLSPTSRAFSKVIHQPAVEKISDAIGSTVARPDAILGGSVVAFLFTLAIYLVARINGYPLSGTETIASFVAGWVLGLIIDYIRLLILGKRS